MPAMKCSQRTKRFSQSITYASMDHCLDSVFPALGATHRWAIGREAGGPIRATSRVDATACELLLRQAALYPFDVEVHLLQLVVTHRLARSDAFLAAVVLDRPLEWMQLAGDDVLLLRGHQRRDVLRDGGVERGELDHAVLDAAPDAGRLPGAGVNFLRDLGVVRTPLMGGRGQMRVLAVLGHVGVIAEGVLALLLRGLHDGGRVRVMGDDVRALRQQRIRRLALAARVVP